MKQPSEYRIMVVDDEPDLREAIAFDLKRKGYQVVLAESGHQALSLVGQAPVDLILSDVRMADGDGIELLDSIKAKDARLPVVMFITGFADITLEEAYDRGADAVFGKPFDRKALMGAIQRALQPPDVRFVRSGSRVDSDLRLGIKFTQSGFSVECRARNFSRGGMFVQLDDKFPQLEKCEFSIEVDLPERFVLSGEGFVRWKREKSSDPSYPKGIGVEFLGFDAGSRTKMIEIINSMKTGSFIPRH